MSPKRRQALHILLLAFSLPALLPAQQSEFKQAGVCSRCHVVSVLEWQISGHRAAETTCTACHGASSAHVANERNEISPDRIPPTDRLPAPAASHQVKIGSTPGPGAGSS